MSENRVMTPLEYGVDGKITVTSTALQETPGLIDAITMCPDDFKPRVTVEVRDATKEEQRMGNIMLARLREELGEEIVLSKRDRRIVDDPRSFGGANVYYVNDRVRNGYGPLSVVKRVVNKVF